MKYQNKIHYLIKLQIMLNKKCLKNFNKKNNKQVMKMKELLNIINNVNINYNMM